MPKNQGKNPSRPQNSGLGFADGMSSFLNGVADAGWELLSRRRAGANPPADIETQCEELMSTLDEISKISARPLDFRSSH